MNRHGLVIAAAVGATLAAGCASTATQNRASEDEKTYVTGSRIPVKDKVHGNVSATTDRKAIEEFMRPAPTGGVVGAGGS
jgi:hypothetical protein